MDLRDGLQGVDFSGIGADADPISVFAAMNNYTQPQAPSDLIPQGGLPSYFDWVSPVNLPSSSLGPYSPSLIKSGADILSDTDIQKQSYFGPNTGYANKPSIYSIPDPGSDIVGSISKNLYSALSDPSGADLGLSIQLRSKFGSGTSMNSDNAGQGRGSVKSNSPDGNSFSLLNSYFTNTGATTSIIEWPKKIVSAIDDAYNKITGTPSPVLRAQLPTSHTQLSISPNPLVTRVAKSAPKTSQNNSIEGTVKTVFDSILSVLTPIAAAKQQKAQQRTASANVRTQPGSGGSGDAMSTYLLLGGGVLAAGILAYVVMKD